MKQSLEEAVMERICAACVDRRDDGSCGIDADLQCAIKLHLPTILKSLEGLQSDQLSDYVERTRRSVCSICEDGTPEVCEVRDKVDCPLDRYLGLVVEAIEEIKRRDDGDVMASAP